jgi:hypothetical protein
MSYTYDLRPEASFEDRYSQFIAFGVPKADVDTLRATIKDMWADAPGGWSYEWSAFARKYLEAGNPLSRRSPTVLPYFPASPTMRGARRSKISLNATSRRHRPSPSNSSAEYSRSPIKAEL